MLPRLETPLHAPSVPAPAEPPAPRRPQPDADHAAHNGTVQLGPSDGTEVENAYRLHRRFDRMGRLFGDQLMERLFASHVMVIGLGGVGSFAAESLARSGIGRLTLVDFDRVCVTNTNRQLQAMKGTVGKAKVQVTAERLRLINPQAEVRPVPRFYDAETAAAILGLAPTSSSTPSITSPPSATCWRPASGWAFRWCVPPAPRVASIRRRWP